jgi:hypothetical protein
MLNRHNPLLMKQTSPINWRRLSFIKRGVSWQIPWVMQSPVIWLILNRPLIVFYVNIFCINLIRFSQLNNCLPYCWMIKVSCKSKLISDKNYSFQWSLSIGWINWSGKMSGYRFSTISKRIGLSHHQFPINDCCFFNWYRLIDSPTIQLAGKLKLLLLFERKLKSSLYGLSKIMPLILSLIGNFEPYGFLCFFDHLWLHSTCLFSSPENFDKLMK